MKRLLIWMIVLATIAAGGAAGYNRFYSPRSGANGKYRITTVRRGNIRLVVNSTGTVQPVRSLQVGSFVSGPIQQVFVDFNARVKAGQVMAQIDPRNYKAAVEHEEASVAHSKADIERITALLEQAARNEQRAIKLRAIQKDSISEIDLDQNVTERKSLAAQLKLAQATVRECEANLATSRTNLDFTDIKSPADGVVIDRKVDPGQTVAAQFQTPVMFVVAPDLEKKVYIYASVDEADIGLIREAQKRSEPVTFTVDAYPKDVFEGKIAQVRLNPTTVQNVVTYTVVVESSNAELKLLPGMTANLSFQIEKHLNVLSIPNAALRYCPKPEEVRECDRAILEGTSGDGATNREATDAATATADASAAIRNRTRKHVWIADGELLSAVEVVIGLSDKSSTELVSGELTEGQELISGTATPTSKASAPPPPPPR